MIMPTSNTTHFFLLSCMFFLASCLLISGCSDRSQPVTVAKIKQLQQLQPKKTVTGEKTCNATRPLCEKTLLKAPATNKAMPIPEIPEDTFEPHTPVCITDKNDPNFGDFDPSACSELVEAIATRKGLPADPGPAGKKDVKGLDSNNNGIRDDVERYLEIVYNDPELAPVLDILKKEAVKYQKQLESWESKEMVLAISDENDIEGWCQITLLRKHFPENATSVRHLYEALVFNTYERLIAWNRINSYYSGMTFSMPDDEIISKECNIPLEQLEAMYDDPVE